MRATARLVTILATVLGAACGSTDGLVAPGPSELALTVSFNPDVAGGMRPSTTVSASLFVQPLMGTPVTGTPAERAEFTVRDSAGRVLAEASVPGPLPFEPDRITARAVLDWPSAEGLGRALAIRFLFSRPAPETSPFVIEHTVTF